MGLGSRVTELTWKLEDLAENTTNKSDEELRGQDPKSRKDQEQRHTLHEKLEALSKNIDTLFSEEVAQEDDECKTKKLCLRTDDSSHLS